MRFIQYKFCTSIKLFIMDTVTILFHGYRKYILWYIQLWKLLFSFSLHFYYLLKQFSVLFFIITKGFQLIFLLKKHKTNLNSKKKCFFIFFSQQNRQRRKIMPYLLLTIWSIAFVVAKCVQDTRLRGGSKSNFFIYVKSVLSLDQIMVV